MVKREWFDENQMDVSRVPPAKLGDLQRQLHSTAANQIEDPLSNFGSLLDHTSPVSTQFFEHIFAPAGGEAKPLNIVRLPSPRETPTETAAVDAGARSIGDVYPQEPSRHWRGRKRRAFALASVFVIGMAAGFSSRDHIRGQAEAFVSMLLAAIPGLDDAPILSANVTPDERMARPAAIAAVAPGMAHEGTTTPGDVTPVAMKVDAPLAPARDAAPPQSAEPKAARIVPMQPDGALISSATGSSRTSSSGDALKLPAKLASEATDGSAGIAPASNPSSDLSDTLGGKSGLTAAPKATAMPRQPLVPAKRQKWKKSEGSANGHKLDAGAAAAANPPATPAESTTPDQGPANPSFGARAGRL
jgi:hypothetical protein